MRYPMLETIRSPQQIKNLSLKELLELCKELRERIIEVVSKNGGHLGSNLGAVELTVALHKVFDSPSDMFLWDVSHQTYSHKLLTGRNDRFDTIRLTDGLCGFTDPNESPHDHFHAGHAGAALSSALGVAKTRDLCREDNHILAILGDASLTCGVTLEALNNINNNLQRFIVIVNDNGMSISQNVGAITHILSRLLSNPRSNRFYHSLENLVSRIPLYGKILADQGKKFTQSLKNLVSSAAFFEQYGLAYSGPIDGHDLKKLIDVLEGIKNCDQPVVLHVLTEKGHGMTEGMKNNPINWHGPQPFDPKTGRIHAAAKPKPTFPKIFGKHLLEMGDKDSTLVAVTPAMSLGSCLDPFQQRYPDRCIDVGIAEAHAVTYAGGIAHNRKMKVFMSIYSTFLQRALDNVFHDVCLQNIPLVFAIDRGGIATGDGATHEGIYDMGFLMEMPNMVICQPRNGHLLKELMESAFSWQLPTAIRYPNLATTESEAPIKPRLLGKGEQIADGEDLAIIALGHMCDVAMKAREILKEQGVHTAVIDPIFVKPLDQELLRKLLEKHHRIVTLEEHSIQGGLGTAINNFLMAERIKADVCNLGIPDLFLQHGSHGDLLEKLGLSPQKVAQTIVERFQIQLSVEV